jgi:hypothetical protein
MTLNTLRFVAVVFTSIAMAAAFAHLLELPHKINLSREDYLTVQQLYRGWAWLGIAVVGALVSTLVLTIKVRRAPTTFYCSVR